MNSLIVALGDDKQVLLSPKFLLDSTLSMSADLRQNNIIQIIATTKYFMPKNYCPLSTEEAGGTQ